MATPVTITLDDLTQAKVDGTGAFDTLMRSMVGHLDLEFQKNRIRGADYANVYLNALTPVLQNAVVFLLQKDEAANKAALVDAQVRLTEVQIRLAEAELEREILNKDLIGAQIRKIDRDILSSDKSDALLTAQAAQVSAETLNAAKQGELLTASKLKADAETINVKQQLNNLMAEECVLKSQFDINKSQNLQVVAQTSLVNQKIATEKAQTSGVAIEPTSVIGKQIALYGAQADGFKRDAEQKAAKLMVDSWNVRRTTDVGTVADATNKLNDANIGRTIEALLAGIGA